MAKDANRDRQDNSDRMDQTDLLSIPYDLPVRCLQGGVFSSFLHQPHPRREFSVFELIYVQQGRLSIGDTFRSFEVEPGQSLLLWPRRPHFGTKANELGLSYYWFYFQFTGQASSSSPQDFKVPQHTNVLRPESILLLIHRLLDSLDAGPTESAISDFLLMLVLAEIAYRPANIGHIEQETSLPARANSLIRTGFRQEISTSSLAEKLGCSPDYLTRAYRAAYGRTPTEAIQRKRVEHARHLLTIGELHIDDVAIECGFQEAGYFRRVFKRYEGMTPYTFQKLNKSPYWPTRP
jgi:AraC-like DNA-binding protein